MSQVSKNAFKIENAFRASRERINAAVEAGMIKLLEWGVYKCLEEHSDSRRNHLEIGDSYGYVLLYHGLEITRKIWAKDSKVQGNAEKAINLAKNKAPRTPYCGIIVAGMQPATYFSVGYEISILRKAQQDLQYANFSDFFKPIK